MGRAERRPNARVEVEAASKARGGRVGEPGPTRPAARARAGEEDGVAVEATAPTTRRGASRGATYRIHARAVAVRDNTKTSYSLRAVRLELRVLGDRSPSEQGDAARALEL